MKTSTKIISSVTAAAVVGGGAVLLSEPEPAVPVVDDVTAIQVAIPRVNVPQVQLAQVNPAQVAIPAVNCTVIPSAYEAQQWGLARLVSNYQVILPDGKAVSVNSATVAAMAAVVPELASVLSATPNITVRELVAHLVQLPGVTMEQIQAISAAIPQIADPAERIPAIQSFMAECRRAFRDQRGIQYDRSLNIDNAGFARWLKLYRAKTNYQLAYVPLSNNLRMVAEIHHPIEIETLDRNLEYYAKRGYNAAVLTFGYEGENFRQLLDVAQYIKSKDMQVWFAYSGPEKLQHSVFRDPERLGRELQQLAAVSDGFILGWRRTSLHLFEQDAQYVNFVLKNVRMGNSQIPVLGEAYFGQTASSNERTRNLQYNVPVNCSGVLITGLGYNGVAVDPVVKNLLSAIHNRDKVVLITGDKPYYATRFFNHKSFVDNLKIKEAIAARWQRAGVCSITLHGDGSDGIYNHRHTDNLAQTGGTP